jgi:hypothetical protein
MIKGFRDSKIGKGILENTPLKTFGEPIHIAKMVDNSKIRYDHIYH